MKSAINFFHVKCRSSGEEFSLIHTHNLMVSSSGFVAFSSDFLCTFMYVVMHGVLYQLLNALFKIIMKIDRIKSV